MIVVCPACQARFQYDEQRFEGVPKKRFKCPKCAHVFEIANPGLTSPVPEATTALPDLPGSEIPLTTALRSPYLDAGHQGHTTQRSDRETMLAAAGLGNDPSALMPPGLRFSVAIVAGPQASSVHPLDKPFNTVGREEGEVVSKDPEVSRRHAALEIRRDGTVWLSDLQSTNGTFVGGQRLERTIQIVHQDEFTCGNSTFMLVVRDLNEFPMH
ncbi:MAG TPA: FHA domain-containing protein [Holophagaceae bacterium]|nr:FHA domain-containing protein [Holophagaceae bacterium]